MSVSSHSAHLRGRGGQEDRLGFQQTDKQNDWERGAVISWMVDSGREALGTQILPILEPMTPYGIVVMGG